MKTAWMIGLMAGAGALSQAQEATPAVTAYVRSDPAVPMATLAIAQQVAAKIFAGIGVPVRWRNGTPPENGGVAVGIRVQADVLGLSPSGLAVTSPEKGLAIISVSYKRVASRYRHDRTPDVLGYVLAHEMAHVLQGAARHSGTGILKAHWDYKDYQEMDRGRLAFASEDVMLIRRWIKAAAVETEIAGLAVLR